MQPCLLATILICNSMQTLDYRRHDHALERGKGAFHGHAHGRDTGKTVSFVPRKAVQMRL
jgi:hypothetical protein